MNLSGKNILVAGGTGMIGQYLVRLLLEKGAKVTIAALDSPELVPDGVSYMRLNLKDAVNCVQACNGMDVVFNLVGIKTSPKIMKERPATTMSSYFQFNTNMLEAAFRNGVEWYLYTSSIGVYGEGQVLKEDDVWSTFPSKNDWFAGWSKRMGELHVDAYRIEYDWKKVSIVRPANVYGRFDNFDPVTAMVVPSLIHRLFSGENPFVVWGNGSAIRDFIHAKDVARGMLFVVENEITKPMNLGSGQGYSIKTLVDMLLKVSKKEDILVAWDDTKPTGDVRRILDTSFAQSLGFNSTISLLEGLQDTYTWYEQNQELFKKRFDVFKKG